MLACKLGVDLHMDPVVPSPVTRQFWPIAYCNSQRSEAVIAPTSSDIECLHWLREATPHGQTAGALQVLDGRLIAELKLTTIRGLGQLALGRRCCPGLMPKSDDSPWAEGWHSAQGQNYDPADG